MSRHIHKRHDAAVLLHRLAFPAKHRRAVVGTSVDRALREVCLETEARYRLKLPGTGPDGDHAHFLVQSAPAYSVTGLVTVIKSLTAREVFRRCPGVRERLWGGEFRTDGCLASTVGRHGSEKALGASVRRQGSGCRRPHEQRRLALFRNTPPLGAGILYWLSAAVCVL
jgi:REP element-mobilizing transposase RayT